jgi:hypothetical protein
MTLQEIERKLPNGLHDAQLLWFTVDLAGSTLTLELEVDKSRPEPDRASPEPWPARIKITGLCYFKLDPPDVLNPYAIGSASLIDSGTDAVQKGLVEREVADKLPAGSFLYWIYLNGWNATMVIGALDAQIEFPQASVSAK